MLQLLRKVFSAGGKPAKERRRLPPPGPCPNPGASIVRRETLMKVTEPLSPEFWDWLVLAGWREVRMSKNRRRYETLPSDTLRKLKQCPASERELLHRRLVAVPSRR